MGGVFRQKMTKNDIFDQKFKFGSKIGDKKPPEAMSTTRPRWVGLPPTAQFPTLDYIDPMLDYIDPMLDYIDPDLDYIDPDLDYIYPKTLLVT